jgi:hypothetical protein
VDEVKSGMWSVEKKAEKPKIKPPRIPKVGIPIGLVTEDMRTPAQIEDDERFLEKSTRYNYLMVLKDKEKFCSKDEKEIAA